MSDDNWITTRDEYIAAWLKDKTALAEVKLTEMENRKRVTEFLFPNPTKGTQRYPLNNGHAIKLVHKLNYKLGDDNLINPDTGGKIRKDDQIFELQRRLEDFGEAASLIADRTIKWSAELSVTEYEKLDINDPIQRKIKDEIDKMLTVEPASPTLEFEEPKVKK